MKKIIASAFALCLALSLSGCVDETFGIATNQWNQLTPAQRKIVMRNYYRNQKIQAAHQAEVNKINAENAPMNNLISGALALLPKHTHSWGHGSSNTTVTHPGPGQWDKTTTSHSSSVSFSSPF